MSVQALFAPRSKPVVLTVADRLDIVDALYRLGGGIDANDPALLGSAVTADAVVDFGPAARAMGIDFPVLNGRTALVSAITASVGLLDTTHTVSNPRVLADGSGVRLTAIVEAAHFIPGDHARRCIMKNRYTADVAREDGVWRLARLTVDCAWYDGNPSVLLGG